MRDSHVYMREHITHTHITVIKSEKERDNVTLKIKNKYTSAYNNISEGQKMSDYRNGRIYSKRVSMLFCFFIPDSHSIERNKFNRNI